MSKVGILAYTSGQAKPTIADKPFPEMADAIVYEVFIEDGVPGTIVAVYNDDMAIGASANLQAFTVLVNGHKATVSGAGVSPMDPDHVEIIFTPPAVHGDVVTFQYDCRVDASFVDDREHKPVNYALNAVRNQITAPVTMPIFVGEIGDLHAIVGTAFSKDVSSFFNSGSAPKSYRLNNAPPGMVISKAGLIKWPSPQEGTTSGVSITATNTAGFAVSDAFNVVVDPTGHTVTLTP